MPDQTSSYTGQTQRRDMTPTGKQESTERRQQNVSKKRSSGRRRNRRPNSPDRRQGAAAAPQAASDRSDEKRNSRSQSSRPRRRSSGRKDDRQRRQTRSFSERKDETQRPVESESVRPVSDDGLKRNLPKEKPLEASSKDACLSCRDIAKRVRDDDSSRDADQSGAPRRDRGDGSPGRRADARPRVKRFSDEETVEDIARDSEHIDQSIERQIAEIGRISLNDE